jgi:hypothetical protein
MAEMGQTKSAPWVKIASAPTLYPFIMRVYADFAIIFGAIGGVIYYERNDG